MPSRTQFVLRRFHLLLYVATFGMLMLFWPFADADTPASRLFVLAATAGYSALYVLPAWLLSGGLGWLLSRRLPGWGIPIAYGAAVLGGSAVLLAIYADYRLYSLYQYHFNGFVWNLLTTPGGISALGATEATGRTAAFQAGIVVVACGATLALLHRFQGISWQPNRRRVAAAFAVLFAVLAGEEAVYAYSAHTGEEDYLAAAQAIPFHLRSGASKLFKRLGVEHTAMKELRLAGGAVDYPGEHLAADPKAKMPNIIMLVGESFRWDLLTPEITPNLWRLSQQGMRFEQHYSGGNRTRMGLFSMFYGIYAPYWYSFEKQRVAPALMNFLREHDYQLAAHTSQSFNYPELRHTVFAGVPEASLQELQSGEPWRRDEQNIDDLMGKLDRRDLGRPFYGFMFFESTHAPYDFPEEQALRPDYLREMNYVKLDLKDNIEGIHARYINAAHHIDAQVGRLLARLEQTGMMDNTVILFTGDHGEEFMEKGHWGHGHGSAFTEEQIRVPLVMWMPGKGHQVISHRTSHLQIAPTLLEYLGVTAPSRSYSSADPLDSTMPYFVLGEYDYMAIMDDRYKIAYPYTGSDYFHYTVADSRDLPVDHARNRAVVAEEQGRIDEVTRESMRFLRGKGAGTPAPGS